MSIEDQRRRILDLAKMVWDNQYQYDLDMVDGTFYWRGCRWDLLRQLLEEASRNPAIGLGRIQNLIPGFGFGQGGPMVDEWHIPLRGAVTSVSTITTQLPSGEFANRGVVGVHVRNAQWVGADVASSIHRAWQRYQGLYPDDYWEQHIISLGASAPEHLRMDMRLGPDRKGRLLDISEQETFAFGPGETHVQFTYKPEPDWDYEPRIEVEVSAPPPVEQVIAAWFDDVAVGTYAWPAKLAGAANGQDVATAIRTWVVALLWQSGLTYQEATRDIDFLNMNELKIKGLKSVSSSRFGEDKKRLLARVVEAKGLLDRTAE